MVEYANCLIYILMNINENIRIDRKIAEKGGIPTKLLISQLLNALQWQNMVLS